MDGSRVRSRSSRSRSRHIHAGSYSCGHLYNEHFLGQFLNSKIVSPGVVHSRVISGGAICVHQLHTKSGVSNVSASKCRTHLQHNVRFHRHTTWEIRVKLRRSHKGCFNLVARGRALTPEYKHKQEYIHALTNERKHSLEAGVKKVPKAEPYAEIIKNNHVTRHVQKYSVLSIIGKICILLTRHKSLPVCVANGLKFVSQQAQLQTKRRCVFTLILACKLLTICFSW